MIGYNDQNILVIVEIGIPGCQASEFQFAVVGVLVAL